MLSVLGDKSEVIDVENADLKEFPLFAKASRYSTVLEPGDIIFIPGGAYCNCMSTYIQ